MGKLISRFIMFIVTIIMLFTMKYTYIYDMETIFFNDSYNIVYDSTREEIYSEVNYRIKTKYQGLNLYFSKGQDHLFFKRNRAIYGELKPLGDNEAIIGDRASIKLIGYKESLGSEFTLDNKQYKVIAVIQNSDDVIIRQDNGRSDIYNSHMEIQVSTANYDDKLAIDDLNKRNLGGDIILKYYNSDYIDLFYNVALIIIILIVSDLIKLIYKSDYNSKNMIQISKYGVLIFLFRYPKFITTNRWIQPIDLKQNIINGLGEVHYLFSSGFESIQIDAFKMILVLTLIVILENIILKKNPKYIVRM